MSSARSISGARQRRAGEPVSVVQQQQQAARQNTRQVQVPNSSAQSANQGVKAPLGKLSVSDAFALVTLRLGRVENILQKIDNEEGIPHSSEGNTRSIDDVVVRSIISRIEDLEKSTKNIQPNKGLEMKTAVLNDKINQLQNDLRDSKDVIFKLQSLVLDLNQKIMSIVIPSPPVSSPALFVSVTQPPAPLPISATEANESHSDPEPEAEQDMEMCEDPEQESHMEVNDVDQLSVEEDGEEVISNE